MAAPLAPGVSGLERWSTVSTFLSALSDALGARTSCYVSISADSAPVSSHSGSGLRGSDLHALEVIARHWQDAQVGVDHGDTGRVSTSVLGVVDLATVRGQTGDPHGVLAVVRSANDRTDRSTAAAEMDLAASLVPSVLDATILATARQALVDWAADQSGGRAAFAISVDQLGATNEVLGYRAGDTVLRSLIGRIEFWAGHGRVARAGGARYLVIRTDLTDEPAALREVERLRELIAEPVLVEGIAISRSASVGVSVDTAGTLATDALLWGATRAGAAARADGGDSVRVYSEDSAAGRVARLKLDLELAGALSAGELRLHYQPEFDLRTGAIVAVEALLRWQHPDRGMLSADAFVPESEQTRTFVAVQRWVIETACEELARWRAAGLADNLVLRVNVQAPQVLHGGVTAVLFDALARNRLPGSQLCIELTERRMPAELDLLAAELTSWRRQGISVAVDDFGTGEGTLSHLQLLPIDILKIDQRFVAPMTSDARAGAIVAGVIALARSLDLDIVAEGVGGADVSDALVCLGCERGQGNGLAQAMPPDRIAELLALQVLPQSDAG